MKMLASGQLSMLLVALTLCFAGVDLSTVHPTFCPNDTVQTMVYEEVISTPAPQGLYDLLETEFKQQRIDVMPGVYFYIGYALGNCILIDTDEAFILIDTLDSATAIAPVLQDIRETIHPTKPFKAIIYTHGHPDHIGGALAIQSSQEEPLEVWGYHTLADEFWGKYQYNRPRMNTMGTRTIGSDLPDGAFITTGVGPFFLPDNTSSLLMVPPTHYLDSDIESFNIAGLNVTLMYIPGETRDHLAVYIPSMKLLISGDVIYKSHPTLYSIRGTPPRPVQQWASSLNKLSELDIEVLLPSHSLPLYGAEHVRSTLKLYRDSIQYIHDQTTRLMNRGLHPDDIAQQIRLPDSIISNNYTQEFYGVVEWGSKAVYESHFGWFSGFPSDLFPMKPGAEAKKWAEVLDYTIAIESAEESIMEGDQENLRWAIKITSVLWNDRENMPSWKQQEVLSVRSQALRDLAALQTSTNARNYLLRWVLEENCNMTNSGPWFTDVPTIKTLMPVNLLQKMSVMLKAELLDAVHSVNVLHFIDIGQSFTVIIRNSVLEILERESSSPDLLIEVALPDFKTVLLREASLEDVGAVVSPDYAAGDQFMSYFDDPKENFF